MIRRWPAALIVVVSVLTTTATVRELAAAPSADDAAIAHALSRLGFGPRPGDIARVRALGLERWIEGQLTPARLDDSDCVERLRSLPTLTLSTGALQRAYPRLDKDTRAMLKTGGMSRREALERFPADKRPARITAELAAARLVRAVESEQQLQEVMVDFWFNHFNVFVGKGQVRQYLPEYERDVIRPHVLGEFRELLGAVAHSPAMLIYLDNWLSTRPDFVAGAGPNRGRRAGLNENYARELMELHTLGVDGGYTQQDVVEVARCFTGWTIDRPQQGGGFIFRPAAHDRGAKRVLGQVIPAGGGQQDGGSY